MPRNRIRIIVLVVAVALSRAVAAAGPTEGSVCIAPLPPHAEQLDRDTAEGKALRAYSYDFSVEVDNRDPVKVVRDKAHIVRGLALGKSHRVRIFDGRKAIESFRFTFEDRGAKALCLTYGPFYQTWQLWSLEEPGRRAWCKCAAAN